MTKADKTLWYIAGLNFECENCGQCCAGPDTGYIWVTKTEIKMIADYLKIPVELLREKYLKSVGFRTSIIEHPQSKDCIFLQEIAAKKGCIIYPVRPNQCRTWPFWNDNLQSEYTWNRAAMKCPGVNRGTKYTCDQIEKLRKQKKWWENDDTNTST